jgi:hypothetical protein
MSDTMNGGRSIGYRCCPKKVKFLRAAFLLAFVCGLIVVADKLMSCVGF